MTDIVERLRELEAVESELALECDCPPEATANYRYAMTCAEAADTITALRAENERLTAEIASLTEEFRIQNNDLGKALLENERLRAYALKAFTVVEFCCGEGLLLETPFYDCDDLLLEGVNLLNVETAEEARAALEERK